MEFLSFFRDQTWTGSANRYGYFILPVLLIATVLLIHRWISLPKLNLPPGPIGLPFVGYLPFLGKEPYKTLDKLKKKYGNVYSMYLGQNYVVILADYPAVEEAYDKMAVSNRPPMMFDFLPDRLGSAKQKVHLLILRDAINREFIGRRRLSRTGKIRNSCHEQFSNSRDFLLEIVIYSYGFASLNGPDWVEQRRFTIKTMRNLGLGKSTWNNLVEDELSDFLELIKSKNGQPIDIYEYLTPSISNNICSFLFGKRLPPGPDRNMLNVSLDAIVRFFSHTCLWNYYPRLCLLLTKLRVRWYYDAFKEMVAFNKFMRNQIENHKKSQNEDDFISQFLQAMESNKGQGKSTNFTDQMMVGSTQTLFVGGSDTTRTSLAWLFMTMALHPEVQQKVHHELQSVLGKERWATWDDRMKLPYTFAVIMESQRWTSLVPLNTPHWVSEDSKICGYDIPKGTVVISNTWGLHNDPRYWKEPEKFMPERFLINEGKEVDLKAESFLPFSCGKRRCPGEKIAMMELLLYFTGMMKMFEVQVPKDRSVIMEGILGITYQPVSQQLCFVPRR